MNKQKDIFSSIHKIKYCEVCLKKIEQQQMCYICIHNPFIQSKIKFCMSCLERHSIKHLKDNNSNGDMFHSHKLKPILEEFIDLNEIDGNNTNLF